MIRLISFAGMIASGGLLAWYQCLTKTERQQADAAATDAARKLYRLGAESQEGNPLTHLTNRFFD